MAKFIMMIGLPGSGKSREAEEWKKMLDKVEVLSSDKIREEICGGVADQTQNQKVFRMMEDRTISYLTQDINVIYDATNTTLKGRKHILEVVKSISTVDDIIAVVMNTSPNECIKRDAGRGEADSSEKHKVGRDVIFKYLSSFQFPQLFEGFTKIKICNTDNSRTFNERVKLLGYMEDEMLQFDQKNPHHIYTVGEHCKKVAELNADDEVRYLAGLYHDIGKVLTQKIDENGVGHYYNHDSIGTYFLMNYHEALIKKYPILDQPNNLYEFLFYVNYHMRGHNDFASPKAEKKYRKIFGDERFESLLKFAETDKIGSGTYKEEE